MANKVKITDGQGVQMFPITHVSAVIDNDGNSVEQVLGAQTDLIQQAQMEIGAVPSDLTPTKNSSNWVTSGGIRGFVDGRTMSEKENEFVLADSLVATNNTNYLTPSKTESGAKWVVKKKDTSVTRQAYVSIQTLKQGKKYRIAFDFTSTVSSTISCYLDRYYNGTATAQRQQLKADITDGGTTGHFETEVEINYSDIEYITFRLYQNPVNGYLQIDNIEIVEVMYALDWVEKNIASIDALEKGTFYTLPRMMNLARFRLDSVSNIGFLHFSDLHEDNIAFAELKEFVSKYGDKFSDIIETGDNTYTIGTTAQLRISDSALFVPGNHDVTDGVNSYSWADLSKEYCFNKFVAPYITARGITMPAGYDVEGDDNQYAMYWHKDYNNGYDKVRLIGIDCMHYYHMEPAYTNNAQETWLANLLADALANNFKVIIASHYPLDDFDGDYAKWDDTNHRWKYNYITDSADNNGGRAMSGRTDSPVNFHQRTVGSFTAYAKQHLRERPNKNTKSDDTTAYPNNFGNIITSFIDNGGVFIAWICGHLHGQEMFYPKLFPKILNIVVPSAGTTMFGYDTETPTMNRRDDGVYKRLCCNLYYVQGDYLKIVRVGNNINCTDLSCSSWMTINYRTGEVVSEG